MLERGIFVQRVSSTSSNYCTFWQRSASYMSQCSESIYRNYVSLFFERIHPSLASITLHGFLTFFRRVWPLEESVLLINKNIIRRLDIDVWSFDHFPSIYSPRCHQKTTCRLRLSQDKSNCEMHCLFCKSSVVHYWRVVFKKKALCCQSHLIAQCCDLRKPLVMIFFL